MVRRGETGISVDLAGNAEREEETAMPSYSDRDNSKHRDCETIGIPRDEKRLTGRQRRTCRHPHLNLDQIEILANGSQYVSEFIRRMHARVKSYERHGKPK